HLRALPSRLHAGSIPVSPLRCEEKRREWDCTRVFVYILPEAWNSAKVLLSGSWRIANHPMFGISSLPLATFAPRFVALARDWSMLTTLKLLRNPVSPMGGLYKKTMGETGFLNHFSVVNIDQSLAKATNLGAKVAKGKEEIQTSDGSRSSKTRKTTPSHCSKPQAECSQDSRTILLPLFSSHRSGETGMLPACNRDGSALRCVRCANCSTNREAA